MLSSLLEFVLLDATQHISICSAMALRLIVRDMGNDVDRVEQSDVLPMEAAYEETKLHGRTPLSLPYSERFKDLCASAVQQRGRCPSCPGCVPLGSVRPLDEKTVEIIVWRRV